MGKTAIVAVLAGGRGRRLGGAKAIRTLAGRPLISYPLAAARTAGLDAVVVAKLDTALPELAEPVLYEPEQPAHPLCGVIAALEHAGTLGPPAAVVLTACDMPFLTGELLRWLAEIDGAVMSEVDGRPQPLLARCLPEHRGPLERALAAASSLTAAMMALEPTIVGSSELSAFGPPERLCFNVNDDSQLGMAEELLA